jgi:hypothetical protein
MTGNKRYSRVVDRRILEPIFVVPPGQNAK